MEFTETNRKLESSTGFIKRKKEEFSVFKTPIYLAAADSIDNYEEISSKEYFQILKAEEDKIRAEFEAHQKELEEEEPK